MTIFYLPDLGEGLAEAIIYEWHVTANEAIQTDQIMLSVETAKSVVDIPVPFSGKVLQIFFPAGATVKTGEALIDILTAEADNTATVAGKLESSDIILAEENFGDQNSESDHHHNFSSDTHKRFQWQSSGENLSGLRLSMAKNMRRAHREVIQAVIFDEADISNWFISDPENSHVSIIKTDITVKIIQAIIQACHTEPALNAWYDGRMQKRLLHSHINIGLALDTAEGLLVPVIKNAQQKDADAIRNNINDFKQKIFHTESFQEATITLSNIGSYAGYFATPIVVPPAVAIIASGRIDKNKKLLPLSLSFDHRVVTGAEAARFLAALLKNL